MRQFLRRAQEARRSPEELLEAAAAADLGGWIELAGFYRRYLDVLYDRGRGRLRRADRPGGERRGREATRCTTTSWSTTTRRRPFAIARLLVELRPTSLVVAGDAGCARVLVPGDDRPSAAASSRETFPAGRRSSSRPRIGTRAPRDPSSRRGTACTAPRSTPRSRASCAGSTSRRTSRGADLGVIVRRAGTDVGGPAPRARRRRRAQGGARDAVWPCRPSRRRSPIVLALRWLAPARGARRADRGGADVRARRAVAGGRPGTVAVGRRARPASRRGRSSWTRVSRPTRPSRSRRSAAVLDRRRRVWRTARSSTRSRSCGGELPCSRRLVDATATAAGADLDAVRSLADAVERVSRAGRPPRWRASSSCWTAARAPGSGPADAEARRRRPRPHGPRSRRPGVRHGRRRGRCSRGTSPACPGPSRCSTSTALERRDLAVRAQPPPPGGRTAAVPRGGRRGRGGACCSPPARPARGEPGVGAPSRFVAEARRRVGRRCRTRPPASPCRSGRPPRPGAATWRDPADAPAVRLAALDGTGRARRRSVARGGSSGTGPTPGRRCTSTSACPTRGWTSWRTARCSTSWARSSGWRAAPATTRGWAAWCTRLIEECEDGRIERTAEALVAAAEHAVAPAGVPVDGRLRGVPRRRHRADAPGVVARSTARRRRARRRCGSSSSSTARPSPATSTASAPCRAAGSHHHGLQDRQEARTPPSPRTTCSSASTTWR